MAHRITLIVGLLAVAVINAPRVGGSAIQPPVNIGTTLWYRQPAAQWDHAMPLGNGRLGAMVFGNVNRERIQLNESSLWMGGTMERDNPQALKHLPEVRRLLFAGAPADVYRLADKYLMARPQRLQSYQTLGDLRLTFDHEEHIGDYRRELDLDSGSFASRTAPARPVSRGRSLSAIRTRPSWSALWPTGRRHSTSRSGWIVRRMPSPSSTATTA